ncbi:MAG: gliding motility lipoprotein GldH [Paludibacteraceae bacterium]|nr:gliding motility lipoprotein GldH [Paludibacteraceae bacterium]
MKRIISILLIVGAILSFSGCRRGIVYSQFCSIPSEKWGIDELAQFDYSIIDTAVDYRMLIYVRHTERYPYQNMWLFVSDSHHCDTIEFYLADDRGQWLGDKHNGFIEMPVLFEESKHFPDTGQYHLSIQHGMRDSVLRGITDIGLEIIKNGEE